MSDVTIAIIDRSDFFRSGVHQQLSSQGDFRIVDCDPDHEPLQCLDVNSVDVVLLDIDHPVTRGLALCRAIAQRHPNTRVIVLSSYFSDEELFETLKTGAAGYVDKRTSAQDLIGTIRKASRAEYPINDTVNASPAIADRVIRQFQQMALSGLVREKLAAPLTNRELQILACIANGGTNKRIAHELGISEQTIKNHVSAILRKLNANDRAHAVAVAVRSQWVSVEAR